MKKLGFVILTWNSEKVIGNCLESIAKLKDYEVKVVVVDNGSTDETLIIIENHKQLFCDEKHLELLSLNCNMGTTKSRNMGIKKMHDRDYICILDSDTVINQDAIDHMIDVLEIDARNGIVGPKMETSEGVLQNSGRHIPTIKEKIYKVLPFKSAQNKANHMERYDDIKGDVVRPVGYLMSACWLIKQEVIEDVGLLDENIFYAPEDVEYCIRVWRSNFRVLYDNNSSIIHEWQRLSRKKLISKHNYEHIKGLLYMYRKHKFLFNADKIEKLVY